MFCPFCKKIQLIEKVFFGTAVDYCPDCLGLWFDKDELRQAKDEKDKDLKWLDIDLWREKEKFRITPAPKICPACLVPMYEANYGDSGGGSENLAIKIDLCNVCQGIWLDRGEFKKIMDYLKRKGHYEVMNKYFKNIIIEAVEVFVGPESFKSELGDFLTILKILKYKFLIQHPGISNIIASLPK